MPWAFYERLEHRPIAAWQSGGVSRLLSVGTLLRLPEHEAGIRRAISQSVVYGPQPVGQRQPLDSLAAAALQTLEAIVTRSELVPVAPEVDQRIREVLETRFGWSPGDQLDADETTSLASRWCKTRLVPATGAPLRQFDDEPDGAKLERKVWDDLQSADNGRLRAWAHPQPSFGALLDQVDDRRAVGR
jgi:hypothetical protein